MIKSEENFFFYLNFPIAILIYKMFVYVYIQFLCFFFVYHNVFKYNHGFSLSNKITYMWLILFFFCFFFVNFELNSKKYPKINYFLGFFDVDFFFLFFSFILKFFCFILLCYLYNIYLQKIRKV